MQWQDYATAVLVVLTAVAVLAVVGYAIFASLSCSAIKA
jgi:hypothetical protein